MLCCKTIFSLWLEPKQWDRKRKKREEIVESKQAVGGLAPPDCEFKQKTSYVWIPLIICPETINGQKCPLWIFWRYPPRCFLFATFFAPTFEKLRHSSWGNGKNTLISTNPSVENLTQIFLCKITSFVRNIRFQTKNWEKIKILRLYWKKSWPPSQISIIFFHSNFKSDFPSCAWCVQILFFCLTILRKVPEVRV